MSKRRQADAEPPDEFSALAEKVILANEQRWDFWNVPPEERDQLRPGIVAQVRRVFDRLRAEHLERTRR